MKVIIKTEYTNVDQEWLDWWFNTLKESSTLPGACEIVVELKKYCCASFTSYDPTSDTVGETSYEIIK